MLPEKQVLRLPLSIHRLRQVLSYDPETGIFKWLVTRNQKHAGSPAGNLRLDGWRMIKVDGRFYFAGQLAWFYMTGTWATKDVDHINRNRDDNRFSNLREASRSQNAFNSRGRKSGLKWAYWNKNLNRWQSSIRVDGKNLSQGYYDTPEEAHAAAYLAAKRLRGEFARAC